MISGIVSNPMVKFVISKFRSSCEVIGLKSLCDSKSDEYFFFVIVLSILVGLFSVSWTTSSLHKVSESIEEAVVKEVEPPKPLRDFTIDQLREFNGQDDKPIYIALRGEVYDVSRAKDMYGPDGG
jgi:hypothetical protein